ncbi:MAG: hypothetical protein IT196_17935 [Acidimicrobiales bacterium]|nr:hypothetical protein [Acidimicrobiales bacterium]
MTAAEIKCRSAFEALLSESHGATGRDDDGNVVDADRLGSWLGAMGYLSLIDQVGKCLRWTNRAHAGQSSFEAILQQHGVDPVDAAALYALRNAIAHSYGLANENTKRPDLQHFFTLNAWGGSPLVEPPTTPWNGDPHHAAGRETTVSLQALGNLGGLLTLDLQETWARTRNSSSRRGSRPPRCGGATSFITLRGVSHFVLGS